jgi:hypothetical protein
LEFSVDFVNSEREKLVWKKALWWELEETPSSWWWWERKGAVRRGRRWVQSGQEEAEGKLVRCWLCLCSWWKKEVEIERIGVFRDQKERKQPKGSEGHV